MATRAENLSASLDNIARLIRELTEDPNPTYTTAAGRTVQKTEYLRELVAQQEILEQTVARAGGPYELRSVGIT